MDVSPPPLEQPSRPKHRLPHWTDTRALTILVVAALALALFWWWTGRSQQDIAVIGAKSLPSAEASSTSTPTQPGDAITVTDRSPGTERPRDQAPTSQPLAPANESEVVVDVRGGVRDRGVHVLPTGSRVIDAIDAAGGLRPGRSYGGLNLAEVLSDGQQLIVGQQPGSGDSTQPARAGSANSTNATSPDRAELVNINLATPDQLESLPGVGPVLAERIVAWRDDHGRFAAAEDLLDVSGIGDKVLAGLRDSVSV